MDKIRPSVCVAGGTERFARPVVLAWHEQPLSAVSGDLLAYLASTVGRFRQSVSVH